MCSLEGRISVVSSVLNFGVNFQRGNLNVPQEEMLLNMDPLKREALVNLGAGVWGTCLLKAGAKRRKVQNMHLMRTC